MRLALRNRPDLSRKQLERTRSLMNAHVRDALVDGHQSLIPALALPDPDDRHVLAAAIQCGADLIVTFNLDDFPERARCRACLPGDAAAPSQPQEPTQDGRGGSRRPYGTTPLNSERVAPGPAVVPPRSHGPGGHNRAGRNTAPTFLPEFRTAGAGVASDRWHVRKLARASRIRQSLSARKPVAARLLG